MSDYAPLYALMIVLGFVWLVGTGLFLLIQMMR